MNIQNNIYAFIVKCLAGVGICYYLYLIFPSYPLDLAMISVLFGLSFENSKKEAADVMLSNILGCAVGLMLLLLPLPRILLILLGLIIVVIFERRSGLTDSIKPALAGLVIVMLQDHQPDYWIPAIQSAVTLTIGCLVGFLLTLLFSFLLPKEMVQPEKLMH